MELIILGLAGSLGTLLSSLFEFIIHRHGHRLSATPNASHYKASAQHRVSTSGVTELRNHRRLNTRHQDHGGSFQHARDMAS